MDNAFALQMLDLTDQQTVRVTPVTIGEVAAAPFQSVVGHADTAAVLSGMLGREVRFNRTSIHLGRGDVLYVAQVTGGRLPEGATTLPQGFKLAFVKVEIV